jgi:hypothetical protein
MRKIVCAGFLLLICLSVFNEAFSQKVILFEDFSSCKDGNHPEGWSNSGETAKWLFKTVSFTHDFTVVNNNDGRFAGIHDEDNEDRRSVKLETEVFSLEEYEDVFLSFDLYFRKYAYKDTLESFFVTISDDNGQTWDTVANLNGNLLYHKEYLDISKWAGSKQVKLCFNYSDNGTWGYGGFFDNIKVYEPENIDVELMDINYMDYAVFNDRVYINGKVQNLGAETINSVEIAYSVNGNNAVKQTFNGLAASSFEKINFVHNTPWMVDRMGVHDIDIWVNKINGKRNRNAKRHKLSASGVNVVDSYTKKNVLLEVFAASWCTLCLDAGANVKRIIDSVSNVIPVAIHIPNYKNDTTFQYRNKDPMYCTDGMAICNNYHANPGWLASGMIDRYQFDKEVKIDLDRDSWSKHIYRRAESVAPVSIKLEQDYSYATKELTVDITAKFTCDLTGDYRFNCYIIEDNIEFDQYSWYCNPDRIPYYHNDAWNSTAGKTEHITNFKHMNVLREAIGGVHGVVNSLPEEIQRGREYKWRFNYSVPENFDINNLSLIGIVKRGNGQHEILNSQKVSVIKRDS